MSDNKGLSAIALALGVFWYFWKKRQVPLAGPYYRLPIGWAKKDKELEMSDVEVAIAGARAAPRLLVESEEEATVLEAFRPPRRTPGWVI